MNGFHARSAPIKQTLTEQTLTRIWRELAGDWLELNAQLRRIASILIDNGCGDESVRLFLEAAEFALDRLAFDIHYKAAA